MKQNDRLLKIFAMIISVNMILGCLSTTVAADGILLSRVKTEQAEEEPAEEPEEDTEDPDEESDVEPDDPEDEEESEEPADEPEDEDEDESDPEEPEADAEEADEEDDEDELLFANADYAEVSTFEELMAAVEQVRVGGTVTLTADIDTSAMIEIDRGRIITLDLNGHTLNRGRTTCDADGHVIIVYDGGILTVTDTSAEGTGLITGGYANNGGGINNKGTLSLEGITISGNCGDDAGGIYNYPTGILTMENVTISGNTSVNHGGGGIDNYGVINILGDCTITGNSAASNGGGIWSDGTIRMSGCNYIRDNYSALGTHNLFLKTGKVIDVEGSLTGEIWVSTEAVLPTVTRGWIASDDINVFKFDRGYEPENYEGEVKPFAVYMYRQWDPETNTVNESTAVVPEFAEPLTGGSIDSGWYYVSGNQTIDSCVWIEGGSNVNIVLEDGCDLYCKRGIMVPSTAVLCIYGQANDSGVMNAIGTLNCPGIGATEDQDSNGFIYIFGGTVNATGSKCAAGIGTGYSDTLGMAYPGENITILGGYVNAVGGEHGAGIGGGSESRGSNIYIYGGTVSAAGGYEAAGIGGGWGAGCPKKLFIYGGDITATGGGGAAGIGEGYECLDLLSSNSTITIENGTVTAYGGSAGGAGIGGGTGVNTCVSIVINGGTVNAYGGSASHARAGAGIGAGSYTNVIGGGGDFEGSVSITGGHVHAEASGWVSGSSYSGAAGIGGGLNGDMTGTVTISGRSTEVECIGRGGGAAIGGGSNDFGGYGDCTGTVSFLGGQTTLLDASYDSMSYHPQLVGHGADADDSGTIRFAENMLVWHTGQPSVPYDQRASALHSSSGLLTFVRGY